MLAGMGTVFAFLTALVAAMTLMSTAIIRLQQRSHTESEVSDEEVAAISAAIARHRNNR